MLVEAWFVRVLGVGGDGVCSGAGESWGVDEVRNAKRRLFFCGDGWSCVMFGFLWGARIFCSVFVEWAYAGKSGRGRL